MRVAVLYIAEAYQVYHGASVALAMAERPGWEVVTYYHDPDTPHHLERIREAFDAPAQDWRPLRRSWLTRQLQSRLRKLSLFKDMVMWDNRRELAGYDAIFAVENTVASLRSMGVRRPRLIYSPHGFGDRARGFIPRIATFDFVLVAGPKTANRMLEMGLIRPDAHALTGVIKLEVAARLALNWKAPFERMQPTVLYNAHKEPKLTSWNRFVEPMLDAFASDPRMNLIVAPHVKMFFREEEATRETWRARSTGNVLVDPGSDRSMDMTYAAYADIYVGDVSSQVYEFLDRPKPCVFLNAHGVDWQADPSFAHWHLGDVVDDPADLMRAIREAPQRHALYRDRQQRMIAETLGDLGPGAARRASDAIASFLASAGLG